MEITNCARRSSCQVIFGQGFDSPQLHHVGRSLLHSASAVSVRAAKAPYPQAPSSFSPFDCAAGLLLFPIEARFDGAPNPRVRGSYQGSDAPPRRKKPAPFRFRGFRKSRESSISAGSFLLFPFPIEAHFDGAHKSARLRSPGFVRAGPPSTVLRGSSFSPSKTASMGPPICASGVLIRVV